MKLRMKMKKRVTSRSLKNGQTIYFVDTDGEEKGFIKTLKFPKKFLINGVSTNFLTMLKKDIKNFEDKNLKAPYFYSKKKAKTYMNRLNNKTKEER